MSARKFKLDALLSYRHFLKTQAAGRLAHAARERLEAYEALLRCESKLNEMEQLLDPQYSKSVRASDLLLIQKGISAQRQQIEEANGIYSKAVDAEKISHNEVIQAQQDYEALLKLEEKHKNMVRSEELKAEERALDEFTNAQFKQVAKA